VGGRATGLIGLSCSRHRGTHDPDDVRFFGELADRIALAAENARLVARLQNELERRSQIERRHAALLQQSSDLVVVLDERGRVVDATPGVTRVLGWETDAIIGADVFDVAHPDDRERQLGVLGVVVDVPGPTEAAEFRITTASGETVWIEARANNLLHDPAVRGIVVTGRDITERHRAAELLEAENAVLAGIAAGASLASILERICRLVESATSGIASVWRLEPELGLVFWAGPSMPEGVFDVDHQAMGGEPDTWVPYLVDRIDVADARTHPQWRGWREVAERFGVAGSWSRAIVDPHGVIVGAFVVYLGELREPSRREGQVIELATKLAGVALDRDRASEAMAHAAMHDALTGLPNRRLFLERLATSLRRGESTAVLFVDLDDFKHVNDSTGHAAGDRLLQEAALRLQAGLRPSDTIARLGGDEFAVLCRDVADGERAGAVARRVLAALDDPFVVARREFHVTASIGIALAERESTSTSLLRDADAAMYRAKADGRGRHVVFTPDVREATLERHTIESDLRRAIEQGELVPHYQPVVDLRHGRLSALEALVRWHHPTRGLVGPAGFIGVAEDTGLILPLGETVLEQACAQMADWIARGVVHPRVHVAVNVSMIQLLDGSLPETVIDVLDRSGLSPLNLHLELTESAVMEDAERTAETIGRLRDIGVRFVIDDFGTGHSSLARLRTIDTEILKLDRSFVVDLDADPASEEVAASVVRLAHALGKGLVAEGVERAEQLAVLRRLGADAAQGFHLARPMPADDIERLLASDPVW
jgi:diguanylate cyclase (GGDEF)-like protein/PAS domain S-box-containing protein